MVHLVCPCKKSARPAGGAVVAPGLRVFKVDSSIFLPRRPIRGQFSSWSGAGAGSETGPEPGPGPTWSWQRFGKGSSAAGNNFTKFCGGSASGFWISSNKAQCLTPSHLRLTPSQQSRRGPLIFLLLLLISILPRSLGRGTESDWLFVLQPGDSRAAAPVHLRTSLEFRNEKLLVLI